ncbi:hypothetical protein [Streptomyces sp. SID3343]|nr:hypothetical protein [Streptomyces sp. SID3343]
MLCVAVPSTELPLHRPKELWELVAGHASVDEPMTHLGVTGVVAR